MDFLTSLVIVTTSIIVFIVPLLLLCFFIYKRNKQSIIIGLLYLTILFMFFNSTFYKARRRVDVEWLYGRTIEEAAKRYIPYLDHKGDFVEEEEGILITREIFWWSVWEGVRGVYIYAVKLDDEERICEVNRIEVGYQYRKETSYWNRWGIIP